MSNPKYTVLRAVGVQSPPFLNLNPLGPTLKALDAISEIRLDVESLTPTDIRQLARDPEVKGIARSMPVQLVRPFAVAADAQATSAWGIDAIGPTTMDGSGVVPAVLDTGIDAGHEAFQGVTLEEKDFSGSGNGDQNGHGTHCAGTIFGRDVGGTRIGIARGVTKALIGKVLADDGSGDSESLFQAIEWALSRGAQVISMSLGFDFPGFAKRLQAQGTPVDIATSMALVAYRDNLRVFDSLMDLCRARIALDGGAVIVAAAGNESRRDENPQFEVAASLPAAAKGMISVAALQRGPNGLGVAPFSNTLADISAPGVGVLSARNGGGLRTLSGTSMATPHVAGVATLWWQAVRAQPVIATASLVDAKLRATARSNVFAPGVDIADRGVGLVTAP